MSELAPAAAERVKAGQRSLWTSGDYAKLSARFSSEYLLVTARRSDSA